MDGYLRKMLRRTCWTLATAGSLGLGAGALAQVIPGQARPPGLEQSVADDSARPLVASDARLAEIKVELAWLADPAIRGFRLEAHTLGSGLEIRGYVPNEAVHGQALDLARRESGLRVVDHVAVRKRMLPTPVSKPAEVIQQQAEAMLQRYLPLQARELAIEVWTDGQIVVKGTVANYEEKLAVSRCLRRVSGCSCVVNQAVVGSAPVQNQASARATVEAAGTVVPVSAAVVQTGPVTAQPQAAPGEAPGQAGEDNPQVSSGLVLIPVPADGSTPAASPSTSTTARPTPPGDTGQPLQASAGSSGRHRFAALLPSHRLAAPR